MDQGKYMVTLSLLISVFIKLQCRTPEPKAIPFSLSSIYWITYKNYPDSWEPQDPVTRMARTITGPFLQVKKYLFFLRLFLIFNWFLFQVCHKNQQTVDNLPTNSLLTTVLSLNKRYAGFLDHQEIALPGICYFLFAIVEFCTAENLKLPTVSGH